jgi:hypothetical protein
MNLEIDSLLFFNQSNLVLIFCQLILIIVAFSFFKKNKFIVSSVFLLSVNFSFIPYLIWENYNSFYHIINFYSPGGSVPTLNILPALSGTQVFYIVELIIHLISLILFLTILRKLKILTKTL